MVVTSQQQRGKQARRAFPDDHDFQRVAPRRCRGVRSL